MPLEHTLIIEGHITRSISTTTEQRINRHLRHCIITSCGDANVMCWVRYTHSGNYEARGASGRKYEARMVIFCILAAVNRFSQISWKEESL